MAARFIKPALAREMIEGGKGALQRAAQQAEQNRRG